MICKYSMRAFYKNFYVNFTGYPAGFQISCDVLDSGYSAGYFPIPDLDYDRISRKAHIRRNWNIILDAIWLGYDLENDSWLPQYDLEIR